MLWGNLLAMALVVVVLVVVVMVGLNIYTRHGQVITVPDVRMHTLENAEHVLESLGLEVEVTDTGYVKTLAPGTVLAQSIADGTKVKEGRVVYLTINGDESPTLVLPDIIDNSSLREAQARLKSLGFKLGGTEYVTGEKDWVYGVKCGNRMLRTGDRVPVDDILIIQAGNGARDESDSVYVTDPEIDYPEFGDAGEEDGFEIVY